MTMVRRDPPRSHTRCLDRLLAVSLSIASVAVSSGQSLAAQPTRASCGKAGLVERWYGSVQFHVSTTEQFGRSTWTHTYDWNVTGRVELSRERSEDGAASRTWQGPLRPQVSARERDVTGAGTNQIIILSSRGALKDDHSSGQLVFDCARGTYDLFVSVGTYDMDRTSELPPALKELCDRGADDRTGSARFLCGLTLAKKKEIEARKGQFDVIVQMRDGAFDPSASVLSGSRRVPTNITAISGKTLEVDMRWSLSPTPPEPSQLVVEPLRREEYERWLPLPSRQDFPDAELPAARPLLVRAHFRPARSGGRVPRGRIDLALDDVSSHEGRCNNYPRGVARKQDLRFAAEQPAGVVLDGDSAAHSAEEVSELVVAVEATDTGAYGKVTARCDSLSMTAEHPPTGRPFLSIPMDLDGNHVADAWEKSVGLTVHESEGWDEDAAPPGISVRGDGTSLYNEYRGYVVLENGRKVFKRTHPNERELFVIDAGDIFDTALWKSATGMTAYRLDDSLVLGGKHEDQSRIVDFTTGPPGAQHKFAVRLIAVQGMSDSDCVHDYALGCTACERPGCRPRKSPFAKVMVGRIRAHVDKLVRWIEVALREPTGRQGQMLAESGLPRWLAERAMAYTGDQTKEQLVRAYVNLVTIHEVAHACGVSDHLDDTGQAGSLGERTCPMRYLDRTDTPPIAILQVLFRPDSQMPNQAAYFCRGPAAAPFKCHESLNVKD